MFSGSDAIQYVSAILFVVSSNFFWRYGQLGVSLLVFQNANAYEKMDHDVDRSRGLCWFFKRSDNR